jgi:hypothetical protein
MKASDIKQSFDASMRRTLQIARIGTSLSVVVGLATGVYVSIGLRDGNLGIWSGIIAFLLPFVITICIVTTRMMTSPSSDRPKA